MTAFIGYDTPVRSESRPYTTLLDATWMARPASDRLTELRSTEAWPLLCHLIGREELRLDLEFAAVKNLTGLGSAIEARDPDGFAAGRKAGLVLGAAPSWVETVLGEWLAVLLAWHGGLVSGITNDTVGDLDAALAATQSIRPSSRRAYRNRLAGLRQVLFEARIVDIPPRRRSWGRSYAERFADAADGRRDPQDVVAVCHRPSCRASPEIRRITINDLLPFADYLTTHHTDLTSLHGLDRSHIEGCLAWNRTRTWRGQCAAAGAGRTISMAVIQSTVLSLRNLLDDLTEWAGSRHHRAGWSSPPTSPSSTNRCPAHWHPTSTAW